MPDEPHNRKIGIYVKIETYVDLAKLVYKCKYYSTLCKICKRLENYAAGSWFTLKVKKSQRRFFFVSVLRDDFIFFAQQILDFITPLKKFNVQ